MARLVIHVAQNGQTRYTEVFEGVVDLGRRDSDEWAVPLFAPAEKEWDPRTAPAGLTGKRWRLIVAEPEVVQVIRHAILIPLGAGKVRLHNGGSVPLRVEKVRGPLPKGENIDLSLPAEFYLGTRIAIRVEEGVPVAVQSIPAETPAPGTLLGSSRFPGLIAPEGARIDQQEVIRWLPGLLELLQSAVNSNTFLDRAAQALVDLVGLETGQALLLEGDVWECRASYPPAKSGVPPRAPSSTILNRVREGHLCWETPVEAVQVGESLSNLSAVVAAPIFNREREVIGALYGDRQSRLTPMTSREASLVAVLAHGVALGLSRLEQEEAALAERIRFEQFFTPRVAARLIREGVPEPARTEVTVLFADIRRFSRLSEKLDAAVTIKLCRDVLGALAEGIEGSEGVVVDFIGDGMMALWGAPDNQPDHAVRACRAALELFRRLKTLNERWKEVIGEEIELSVGLNTGFAQVGNVGTERRVKFGALGNMVNIASRIEGVTRALNCRALMSRATLDSLIEHLGPGEDLEKAFPYRRMGLVKVVNIEAPADLYELNVAGLTEWDVRRREYEAALTSFEQREFPLAARTLGNHRLKYGDDGPSLVLLSRAVQGMLHGPADGHPVLVLANK
jgi:adenylate cyclase